MAQGGDVVNADGSGCASIYNGGTSFDDEWLGGRHDRAGVVSSANEGPNSNGAQFFITFNACSHLDGKHVVRTGRGGRAPSTPDPPAPNSQVFGHVTRGMEVVRAIEAVGSKDGEPRPGFECVIIGSGEVEARDRGGGSGATRPQAAKRWALYRHSDDSLEKVEVIKEHLDIGDTCVRGDLGVCGG